MRNRAVLAVLLAASLLLSGAAFAQVGPKMGVIPGTDMTRDEFRARAQAQMAAIALNALAYHSVNSAYPPDYATLLASPTTGLRVRNMFSDRNVRGISFEPRPETLTNSPVMPLGIEMPPAAPPPPPQGPPNPNGERQIVINPSRVGSMRISPSAVREYTAGDVVYYTSGNLLQIIMFAGDGTFVEWVDETPNGSFAEQVNLGDGATPQQVAAAAMLYYVERQAPKYHNLVQFMGDRQTLPGSQLGELPASKRVELAERMGIIALNPFSRQPVEVVHECSRGDIQASATGPLAVCMDTGPLTLAQLRGTGRQGGRTSPAQAQPPRPGQARPTPGAPGGGRTPGAPGGGRR